MPPLLGWVARRRLFAILRGDSTVCMRKGRERRSVLEPAAAPCHGSRVASASTPLPTSTCRMMRHFCPLFIVAPLLNVKDRYPLVSTKYLNADKGHVSCVGNKVRVAAAARAAFADMRTESATADYCRRERRGKGRERSVTPVRFCHKNCRRGKRGKSQRLNERLDGPCLKKGAPNIMEVAGAQRNDQFHLKCSSN